MENCYKKDISVKAFVCCTFCNAEQNTEMIYQSNKFCLNQTTTNVINAHNLLA